MSSDLEAARLRRARMLVVAAKRLGKPILALAAAALGLWLAASQLLVI